MITMTQLQNTLCLSVIALFGLLLNVACGAQGASSTGAPAQQGPSSTDAPAEQVTMFVGPETVECEGVAPQTCLLIKFDPQSEWELFYNGIIGFEYEPGFEYELLVNKSEIENPPADGSSIQYDLVEVVSQTAVTSEGEGNEGNEGSDAPSSDPLAGTSWLLVSYGPEDAPITVLPNTEITAKFNEAQISGSAGCNHYFGDYQTNQDTITISEVRQTLAGCLGEGIMEQESAFTSALTEAQSFILKEDTLTITYNNGLLHFVPMPVPANISLKGTQWQLTTFIEGDVALSLIANTEINAQFAESKINGTAGCNRYFAGYEIDVNQITFFPISSTRMGCDDEIMTQETNYLTALQAAQTFTVDGDTLTITHPDGELIFNAN